MKQLTDRERVIIPAIISAVDTLPEFEVGYMLGFAQAQANSNATKSYEEFKRQNPACAV